MRTEGSMHSAGCIDPSRKAAQDDKPFQGVASVELRGTPPLEADGAARQPRHQWISFRVGTWLSLVEHSLGVRGVGSSNLPVPTKFFSYLHDENSYFISTVGRP